MEQGLEPGLGAQRIVEANRIQLLSPLHFHERFVAASDPAQKPAIT
jgi:hypothetical protein